MGKTGTAWATPANNMSVTLLSRVKPRHAVLTNLHLDLDYETLKRELPADVEPAYDGMVITQEI